MVDTPEQPDSERREPSAIARYLSVPPAGGFGPYRTGQTVHMLLGLTAGILIWLGLTDGAGLDWKIGVPAIAVALLMSWGLGVRIGMASHYNVLWSLAALGGFILVMGFFFTRAYMGLVVSAAAFFAIRTVLLLLPFSKKRAETSPDDGEAGPGNQDD